MFIYTPSPETEALIESLIYIPSNPVEYVPVYDEHVEAWYSFNDPYSKVPMPFSEEQREDLSIAQTERWKDLNARAKQSETMKKTLKKPVFKARKSAAMRKRYEDPSERTKLAKALTRTYYHVDDPDTLYYGQLAVAQAYNVGKSTIYWWEKKGKVMRVPK